MNSPTIHQIEEAKAYLRKRIEAELSMENNLYSLLQEASKRIVSLQLRFGMSIEEIASSRKPFIKHKVDDIINWLIANIEHDVYLLSTNGEREDKDEIIAFVKRKQYGKTFNERLYNYVDEFIKEIPSKKNIPKAITLLTTYAISEGWMHRLKLKAEKCGSVGFYSIRGSSYPCSLCDSMTGFHPIKEYVGLWHPRCKCFFVFV